MCDDLLVDEDHGASFLLIVEGVHAMLEAACIERYLHLRDNLLPTGLWIDLNESNLRRTHSERGGDNIHQVCLFIGA